MKLKLANLTSNWSPVENNLNMKVPFEGFTQLKELVNTEVFFIGLRPLKSKNN